MAFPIQIKNVGLSPARIDSVAFRYRLLDNLADLAVIPNTLMRYRSTVGFWHLKIQ